MGALTYENPVYDAYFADPFVWRSGELYYAIGTGAAEAAGAVRSSVFPLLASPDLVHWRGFGNALVRPEERLGDTFWAPEIAFRDGTFFLYYSVGHGDRDHQLRVALAERPEGPYRDAAPLTDLATCRFAIDPHPFRDAGGRDYLFHARDFLDHDDRTRAGTALVVQELAAMTRLVGEPRTVLRAHFDWQRFAADRPMYGGTYDWHTLEGPFVLLRDGVYYCTYSGGCWQTPGYGVDFATADHVLGPYSDAGGESGPRLLRGVPERVIGPGHHSVVLGPDGDTEYVCYHAWDPSMTARRLCIDPLVFTAGGPRCLGPTFGAGSLR
jgi:beta-xylosidase